MSFPGAVQEGDEAVQEVVITWVHGAVRQVMKLYTK
jgi:hypothetical protein